MPSARPGQGMGNNVLWWSELVGLNDPMENCQTVLGNETVDTIISNIRPMSVEHCTYMLSELIPFLGAFMAELLRAINEAMAGDQDEIVEVPVDDDEQEALMQLGPEMRSRDPLWRHHVDYATGQPGICAVRCKACNAASTSERNGRGQERTSGITPQNYDRETSPLSWSINKAAQGLL